MTEAERMAEAYLESALEERLGGVAPPDLSKQILAAAEHHKRQGPASPATQPRRWQQLLVAAVLIVAAGITLGIWWMNSGDTSHHENPIQDPTEKTTNPKVVEPKSLEECRQLLGRVSKITARMRLVGKHRLPVKIPDSPPAPEVQLMIPGAPLEKTVAAMAACIKVRPDAVQWTKPHDLYLYLPDGRRLETAVADGRFHVRGLGTFAASRELVESLRAVLAAAEVTTKTELGILHLDEINDSGVIHYGCLGVDARHVRACGLGSGDVVRLSRFRELESVDLRQSPDAHTLEDMRGLLMIEKLRKLRLIGSKVTPAHLEILADMDQLEELILLDWNEAYWRSEIRPGASLVDDAALGHLARMSRLKVLVLPGATITPAGMKTLASLERLQTLVLTGAPHITGTGFAHLEENASLQNLHLGYCTGLTDEGLAQVARLSGLEELFLEGARKQTSSNREPANLTPAGLLHLAKAPRLRRLALGRWFCRRMTHPIIYRSKDVTGFEPTAAMLRALNGVARRPTMRMLSLADCTDLSLNELKSACAGALTLTMLDLSGVVGSGPGMIPPKRLDELMDVVPCTVVF